MSATRKVRRVIFGSAMREFSMSAHQGVPMARHMALLMVDQMVSLKVGPMADQMVFFLNGTKVGNPF